VVSAEELRFRIADHLLDGILDVGLGDSLALLRNIDELVFQAIRCSSREKEVPIDPSLVSIVVASRNRPERLARCLKSLCAQQTNFPVEIIVVDNDPASGLTRPVVKSFPGVRCVDEPVQGLAHARNTGFRAALGDILVATDDDVVTPGFWLREIVQPFRFAHIGVVTGQVVPLALDHEEQRAFEAQGGLGKGRQSFEVGIDWLAKNKWQPPRAWDLGATANAAFRRSLLADPAVGLLPETLGPGTPAGGGEDAYLFYRAVVTGYSVYYEAAAMLQHEHRSNAAALRRQMFDYARGHVSYLLTTVVRDRDFRALVRLVTVLPAWHLWRLLSPFIRLGYRRRIVAAEIAGFLVGPVSWLYSNARDWRLRHKGRTAWTKPVDEIPAAVIQTEMQ
jgi:glycosyltransferase involved in cell wall biosynthesis